MLLSCARLKFKDAFVQWLRGVNVRMPGLLLRQLADELDTVDTAWYSITR
jgi:hypothetical protein